VTNVWQAREVGELRKHGRPVEIRRWRKHARRRKNAKPPFFEGAPSFAIKGSLATGAAFASAECAEGAHTQF